MSQVFHDIEKKIINSLKENSIQSPETLEKSTLLSPDQVRRGIEWLKLKDLAIVDESKSSVISLGKNGLDSFEKGLPERRLLNLVKDGPRKLSEIQKELGFVFGPAIGLSRKNNWIETSSDKIILKTSRSELPGEKTLQKIGNNKLALDKIDKNDLNELLKRPDFVIEDVIKNKKFLDSLIKNVSATLHYMKNDDPISKGEMMLMDFGVRWMTMHADITRSFPVSGKFNQMQKMLYEIVLKGQREVEKAARAGVTIDELNNVCWAVINDGLEKKFVAAGGKYELRYKDRPHGVSHLMGEQEHDGDPFRNYLKQSMKPGWMISNEPGLYGEFKIRLDGKTYDETIGIRIEDNLVMTQKGCINLSRNIPKSVREIERLMKR